MCCVVRGVVSCGAVLRYGMWCCVLWRAVLCCIVMCCDASRVVLRVELYVVLR